MPVKVSIVNESLSFFNQMLKVADPKNSRKSSYQFVITEPAAQMNASY